MDPAVGPTCKFAFAKLTVRWLVPVRDVMRDVYIYDVIHVYACTMCYACVYVRMDVYSAMHAAACTRREEPGWLDAGETP